MPYNFSSYNENWISAVLLFVTAPSFGMVFKLLYRSMSVLV